MIAGRSVNSANFSGDALKESQTRAGISTVCANIFPATLKVRSSVHTSSSVTRGNERQSSRTHSISMPANFPKHEVRQLGSLLKLRNCPGPSQAVHPRGEFDRFQHLIPGQVVRFDHPSLGTTHKSALAVWRQK